MKKKVQMELPPPPRDNGDRIVGRSKRGGWLQLFCYMVVSLFKSYKY